MLGPSGDWIANNGALASMESFGPAVFWVVVLACRRRLAPLVTVSSAYTQKSRDVIVGVGLPIYFVFLDRCASKLSIVIGSNEGPVVGSPCGFLQPIHKLMVHSVFFYYQGTLYDTFY